MADDPYVSVVRTIVVRGPRSVVRDQLERSWLRPGEPKTFGSFGRGTIEEKFRTDEEPLDAPTGGA